MIDNTQTDSLPPTPTAKAERRPSKRTIRNVLIIVGTFIVGLVLGSAGSAEPSATASATPTTVTTTVTGAESTVTETVTTTVAPEAPAADSYTPSTKDVTLKLKTSEKQCFGSAGCNVSVQVKASIDSTLLPDEGTLTAYYTIKGDESGPILGTIELDLAEGTYDQPTENLSTARNSTKLTIKVTDVEYAE